MNQAKPAPLVHRDNLLFTTARSGSRLPNIVIATIVLLAMLAVPFVIEEFLSRALFNDEEQTHSLPHIVIEWTVPFVLMILLLAAWAVFYEKRPLRTVGFAGNSQLRKYGVGLLVGFGMAAGAVGLMAVTGHALPESEPTLPSGTAALGFVFLLLLIFVIQGAAEELLLRGWFMPVVGARHGPWAGVVISTLLFAAFHGCTNTLATINFVLFALFLAFYCLHEQSICGACGWHAAWNWTQANVFGLDVSGYPPEGGVLIDLQAAGSPLLSGGSYGPEGSLMGTIVLLGGVVAIILLARRRSLGSLIKRF